MDKDRLHPMDEPLRSTEKMLEDFQKTVIWADMKNWLENRLEDIYIRMETADTVEEIRTYQGAIKQLRDTLDLPDRLLNEKRELKDEGGYNAEV